MIDQLLRDVILDAHQHSFSILADAWLDQDVTSFFITDSCGEILLHWPPTATPRGSRYTAALKIGSHPIGEVHVDAPSNELTQLRLLTDAQILSDLLQMEYELQRMTADMIEQQDQLMALHQLAETGRVHHDLRQTMKELTQTMAKLLKTNCAFIALVRDEQPLLCEMLPLNACDEQLWTSILEMISNDQATTQWLLQNGREPLNQPLAPLKNLLMRRISLKEDDLLVLGVANKFAGSFQAPDLKLFDTIAGPAVTTIENALMHHEIVMQARVQTEMDLARQVQMRLLPQETPMIAELAIAARTEPASQVGGDFFDFIDDTEGVLTFTIGDVSGKGMPAALMMAMLRTVLRGKIGTQKAIAPDQLMAELNAALYRDFSDVDMFATIFVGQYDYQHHSLHYANDGHAPVIYRPAHGGARLLAADAPPLGVIDMNLAHAYTLPFHEGDMLIITTDGFNEAENGDGTLLGYERLLSFIDTHADIPVNQLAQQLFALVKTFAGEQPQIDDQTLVILKRMPSHEQ